jgi:hypothetical protein
VARKPYQFLLVGVLREYLDRDLRVPTPFPLDRERIYDDFGGAGRARASVAAPCSAGCSLWRPRPRCSCLLIRVVQPQ